MRRPLAKVAYQSFLAIVFGTQLEDLLLEEEIERECAGDQKGKALTGVTAGVSGIVLENQGVTYLVQASQFGFRTGINERIAVVEKIDVTLQQLVLGIGIGVQEVGNVERGTADGEDVHPAVGVTFRDLCNFRSATHASDSLGKGQEQAEFGFFVEALAHHLTVAMLKNVERESGAGQKDDVQREQRNTFRPHESHS